MTNSKTTQQTILIAVDADGNADRMVRAAVTLFGDSAAYRFAHVAQSVPMTMPATAGAPGVAGVAPTGLTPADAERMLDPSEQAASALAVAEMAAGRAAGDAGVPDATAIGLVGDPADALIDEALSCGAVAIVVEAHDRSWLDRLLTQSVAKTLQDRSPMPIVVVPAPS